MPAASVNSRNAYSSRKTQDDSFRKVFGASGLKRFSSIRNMFQRTSSSSSFSPTSPEMVSKKSLFGSKKNKNKNTKKKDKKPSRTVSEPVVSSLLPPVAPAAAVKRESAPAATLKQTTTTAKTTTSLPPPPPAATPNATVPGASPLLKKFQKKVNQVILFKRMFGGKDYDTLYQGQRRADAKSMEKSKSQKQQQLQRLLLLAADNNNNNNNNNNNKSILKHEDSTSSSSSSSLRAVTFRKELEDVKEIEDLTKRDTTWGDIWDDLYFDEEALAEMRYQAFLEDCGTADGEGGDPWE